MSPKKKIDDVIQRYEQSLLGNDAGYFDVSDYEMIVDYYLVEAREDEASRALDAGMRLHANSSELQLLRAKVHLAEGEINKAIQLLDLFAADGDYESSLLRVDAYIRLNRIDESRVIIDQLIRDAESEVDLLCQDIAAICLPEGKYELALSYLQLGLEHNPRNWDLLADLAYCYEQLGEIDESIATYTRLIDMDPFCSEAWYNLGIIHSTRGNNQEALDALEYCLAIKSNDSLAILQKAQVLFVMEQYERSITTCRELLALEGEQWEVYFFIARSYEFLERYPEAIANYEKSLVLEPLSVETIVSLGMCYLKYERLDQAVLCFQRAMIIDPDDYEPHERMGDVYVAKEEWENAIKSYERAAQIAPEQASVFISLGKLHLELEHYDEAITAFMSANKFEANPDHLYFLLALAALKSGRYEELMQLMTDEEYVRERTADGTLNEFDIELRAALREIKDDAFGTFEDNNE